MDIHLSTSTNRIRAFRARRAPVETAEQNKSRLAVDRQYRKRRLIDFGVKNTDEEKQMHLISHSQYEEREERLTTKCPKEVSRRHKLRWHETDVERNTRLERDRDPHRAKTRAKNNSNMATGRNCAVCSYKILTRNWSQLT
ncbi:unnamed protein product, partial [Rotaria magnacalcarata]